MTIDVAYVPIIIGFCWGVLIGAIMIMAVYWWNRR